MTRLALACALALAACGTPEGRSASGTGAAETAYTIGPDGAAGLAAQTPFTVPAMERAFPGLEVVTISDPETPAFHIRETGREMPLYIVTPDWTRGYAGAVATRSAEVSGPGGLRAGESRLSEVAAPLKASCAPPETQSDISLVCESGRLRLEFSGMDGDLLLLQQTYLPPIP
jgi:hypothetical protein